MSGILRIGPWRFGSPFGTTIVDSGPSSDRPDTLDGEIFPVNLANVGWPNQPFVMLTAKSASFSGNPTFAETALGETVSQGSDSLAPPSILFEFYYQATSAFDITFDWTDSGVPLQEGGTLYFNDSSYFYQTIEGGFDSDSNTTGDPSGSYSITLPRTRLGSFGAIIQEVVGGGTVTGRIS
jgi:hypothetical protein